MLFPPKEPNTDFSKLNKLLYGFPKTGKSTFASFMTDSQGRTPLFLATEDGHGALTVSSVRITSWQGFIKLIEYLEDKKDQITKEHSCFVIDLISDLDAMAGAYIAKSQGVEYVGDLDFGKGWTLTRSAFSNALMRLFAILPVTFIAHSAEKEVTWNNEKIKTQAPSMSKGALEFVNGKVDLIMWIAPANSKKEFPEIIMKNTTTCIAGSRYKQLVRNFKYEPATPQNTYSAIAKAFADGVQPLQSKGE